VGGGSLKMTVDGAPCGVIRSGDGVPVQSATRVSDDRDVEQEYRGQIKLHRRREAPAANNGAATRIRRRRRERMNEGYGACTGYGKGEAGARTRHK
jgi:hypothetical protein